MKNKITQYLICLDDEWTWKVLAISAIKVLGYGLLAIVTAIEEKK